METENKERLRSEYSQKIFQKEHQMDNLSNDQKKIQAIFGTLDYEITRNFRELERLNGEDISKGNKPARWAQDELSGKQRYFTGFLQQQNQEFTRNYAKATERVREERDQLQKERSALSWDSSIRVQTHQN
ncbi:hypothetical protein [Enterococcus faecalis]|uniref:hypothetical protein n=1 Tax=Enterococcus faecalis TaxID=1351 RepID=UPI0024782CE7|nr:hypothetical protein [Enterococcus faecalis]